MLNKYSGILDYPFSEIRAFAVGISFQDKINPVSPPPTPEPPDPGPSSLVYWQLILIFLKNSPYKLPKMNRIIFLGTAGGKKRKELNSWDEKFFLAAR